jgi:membrane protease YdiL (CAAX protease family)
VGGRLDVPADQIGWTSGFAVVVAMFDKFAHPAAIVDSFVALATAGALLAWVRARTGNIATSIGLHAAWVCTVAWVRDTTRLDTTQTASWLVGSYDGVMGWGSVCFVIALALAYMALRRLNVSLTAIRARPGTGDEAMKR